MIAMLGMCLTLGVVGIRPASTDPVDSTAHILSDGSAWIMPSLPPALTLFGDEKEQRIGRRMMDAGVAAGLASEGLKRLTRQSRPDDPNATDGFPSGHAAGAWALAEAVGTEDPQLRPYTYALAAGVTWSRVRLDRHTVWQAGAGAALRYALARLSASSPNGLFGGLFVHRRRGIHTGGAATQTPVDPALVGQGPTVTLWATQW
jgi:hypothetical protein